MSDLTAPWAPTHGASVAWDVGIVVRDGVRLSTNLWLPVPNERGKPLSTGRGREPQAEDLANRPSGGERFPAILEMIPYGKDSWRRNADVARGEWLAARGFAFCRLDVRGTGSSGGIAVDEYADDETRDGYEAVEWLAAQPWCDGQVGMWGISYGAFTSIQVAALRPPHLRAIVPVMGSDDRYVDDVHYRGGCLTVSEQSQYAVSQVGMNAMPPDPEFRGPGWRDAWLERLEATPPWTLEWLRRQADGDYWRQGSLAPDYDAINVAILSIGGWMDSYVDPPFRMQERCTAAPERRLIVGPWGHGLPDSAEPGPHLDWLDEIVGFFDRHLRGGALAPDSEPAIRWYQREWTDPEPFPPELAGRWLGSDAFPIAGTINREWGLGGGTIPSVGMLVDGEVAARGGHLTAAGVDSVRHRATLGTAAALSWGAGPPPNGLARDLRPDEAHSLIYTSGSLAEPLDILGVPEAILHLAADVPIASVVVRLTDVGPDGTSAQVSAGILNLTHRRSDTVPEPLVAGQVEEVRIPLRTAGYRWLPGHRIRLTVATQAWPVIWPSPLPATLSVHRGAATPSRLRLPVLPAGSSAIRQALPRRTGTPPDLREVGGGHDEPPEWRIEEDVIAGSVTVHVREAGTTELEDGRSLATAEQLEMTAWVNDPAHAQLSSDVVYRWRERSFETEIRARGRTMSDVGTFIFDLSLEVDLDGERFFERTWQEVVPRHLV